jgi:hypothetical protein
MVQRLPLLVLVVAVVAPAAAAPAVPSFEQSLGAIQLSVAKSAPERKQVHARSELDLMTWDAARLRDDAGRLRNALTWLRERCRRPDAGLRSEVLNYSWQLRDFKNRAADLQRRVERARDEAKKDPAQAGEADRLRSTASWAESDARWLQSDMQWAIWDLRAAGMTFESWDFDTLTRDANTALQQTESAATELARRLRG